MKPLYKTTIVIWTEFDPNADESSIETLAREATNGEGHCSQVTTQQITEPTKDVDWDGTEFFN